MLPNKYLKSPMLWTASLLVGVAIASSVLWGCQPGNPFDPTRVQNDNVTDEILNANPDNTARGIITGLRRTLAIGYGNLSVLTELTSDNYTNATSFVSQLLDTPSLIAGTDLTLGGGAAYNNLLRLNAVTNFAFASIFPRDTRATDQQRAEARFIQGMGLILLAENWSAFPINDKAPPLTARQAIDTAIFRLTQALEFAAREPRVTLDDNAARGDGLGNIRMNCYLALARVHRMAGNKAEARRWCDSALTTNPRYVYFTLYDPQFLTSAISAHVRTRTDHNFQPLPRLDFLDPKLPSDPGADPIPLLKTEEAHLILAEIALSDNNLTEARAQMRNAARLANSRFPVSYTDRNETRRASPAGPALSALLSSVNFAQLGTAQTRIIVRTSPTAPIDTAYATSLVRRRGAGTATDPAAPFLLPTVSATSLTEARIDAVPNNRADLVRTLYLLRQEIFFLESRRMSDLGIRYPVPESQTQTNENMRLGNPGTVVIVPEWIPAGNSEMNRYTVATSDSFTIITIANDMNDVIARNIARISPFSGW